MYRTILLTSTVKPSVVCNGTGIWLQRREEYLEAIRFYLYHTSYPIVIVDNSNYDFYNDIPRTERFESLHYQAEDIGRGKGWGECGILEYALNKSELLKKTEQIIKITGRLKVINIERLLSLCKDPKCVYADSDLKLIYPHSYFFCCSPNFLYKELLPLRYMMNDQKGVHFEHVLGYAIRKWRKKNMFHVFKYPIYLDGHPGNSSIAYKKPSLFRYVIIYLKYLINDLSLLV